MRFSELVEMIKIEFPDIGDRSYFSRLWKYPLNIQYVGLFSATNKLNNMLWIDFIYERPSDNFRYSNLQFEIDLIENKVVVSTVTHKHGYTLDTDIPQITVPRIDISGTTSQYVVPHDFREYFNELIESIKDNGYSGPGSDRDLQ